LHPVIGPFVAAPLLWGLFALRRVRRDCTPPRIAALADIDGRDRALAAAVVLPPLLTHPMALASKGGLDIPDAQTLAGVWYAWVGTPATSVVIACMTLAVLGAGAVWRAVPASRTGVLGLILTFALVAASGPMWSHLPVTISRYLLPFVPLLLLAVAAGTWRVARRSRSRQRIRATRWRLP
jgi:uncharacterized membrane protein